MLHVQGRKIQTVILENKEAGSSEMLLLIYQGTLHNAAEDHNLNIYHRQRLKPYTE